MKLNSFFATRRAGSGLEKSVTVYHTADVPDDVLASIKENAKDPKSGYEYFEPRFVVSEPAKLSNGLIEIHADVQMCTRLEYVPAALYALSLRACGVPVKAKLNDTSVIIDAFSERDTIAQRILEATDSGAQSFHDYKSRVDLESLWEEARPVTDFDFESKYQPEAP